MERIAQVFTLKEGKRDEYIKNHKTVWPELEQLFRDAGVTRYSIYVWEDILFSYMEVENYEAMVEKFNGNELAQKWEEEFAEIIEYPEIDPANGWPVALQEVWNLEV
jgi:L-rhamnose mutarotase